MVSRARELQTAKEILVEVFSARRGEGDDTEEAGGKEMGGGAQVLHGNNKAWPCFCGLSK